MDKQKSNRKNYGTAYYAMAFLAAFFFVFYWIMTNPYEYFIISYIFFQVIIYYICSKILTAAKIFIKLSSSRCFNYA